MSYLFKSERLGFRNWVADDLAPFAAMNVDPRVMEFFPELLTEKESQTLIDNCKTHFDDHGFTFFATCELENNQFIGLIGLKRVLKNLHIAPTVEIGWRLGFSFWGKGYATEGALAMLRMAPSFGIKTVHSFTAAINSRSENIMIKCGMNHVGYFEHPMVDKNSKLRPHTLSKIDLI
jgi:RimJ/RimL family protein N-acetyltransferase